MDKELQKKMHYKEEKKHDKKDKKDKCDDREEIKEVVNEEIKVEEVSPKIEEEKIQTGRTPLLLRQLRLPMKPEGETTASVEM